MNFTFDTTISLGLIVTLVGALIGWVRLQLKRIDTRIDVGNERLDRHDARMSSAEHTLQSLPAKNDIHRVELSISQLLGDVREMRAAMSGDRQIMSRLETVVTRQEEHLLNRSGK